MTVYPKNSLARRLVESDEKPTGYPLGSKGDQLVRKERELKKKKNPKKKITTRDSYQPESDVIKPDKSKKGFKDKLAMYQTITGESPLQPLRDLIDGPPQVNMEVPDLASEVRNRVEMQKQQIASAPKMYPMYYERAKKGKFIKVKTKLGRNRKTKIL